LLSTPFLNDAVTVSYGQASVPVRKGTSTLLLVRTLRRTPVAPAGQALGPYIEPNPGLKPIALGAGPIARRSGGGRNRYRHSGKRAWFQAGETIRCKVLRRAGWEVYFGTKGNE
jgi:hypothetical protein